MGLSLFEGFPRLLLVLAIAVSWQSGLLAQDDVFREWTDKDGQKFQARFESYDTGRITLVTPEGRKVFMRLSEMTAADGRVVLQLKNGIKPKSDMPTEGEDATATKGRPRVGDSEPLKTYGKRGIIPVNWRGVKELKWDDGPYNWNLRPDGIELKVTTTSEPNEIPLQKKRNYSERAYGFVANSEDQLAMLDRTYSYARDFKTHLEIIDLETNEVVDDLIFEKAWSAVGIYDQGTALVLAAEPGYTTQGKYLAVWTVRNGKLSPSHGWNCSPNSNSRGSYLIWTRMLPNDKLATLTADGCLAVWDLRKGKPDFGLIFERKADICVSPNGKYLLYLSQQELAAIDLEQSEVVARKEIKKVDEDEENAHLSISPDGTKIAIAHGVALDFYNFDKAEWIDEVKGIPVRESLVWTDNANLLVDGKSVVNVDESFLVWTFRNANQFLQVGGSTYFLVGDTNSMSLFGYTLPDQQMNALLARAKSEQDFFAVNRGDKVKLDLSKIPDSNQQGIIRGHLEKVLAENYWQISDDADLVIEASMTTTNKKVRFRPFHEPWSLGTEKDVPENVSHIALKKDDKVLWSTSSYRSVYGTLYLKEGESVDQGIQRVSEPDYALFQKAQFPERIPAYGVYSPETTTDLAKNTRGGSGFGAEKKSGFGGSAKSGFGAEKKSGFGAASNDASNDKPNEQPERKTPKRGFGAGNN